MYPDGIVRGHLFYTAQNIHSCVIEQISKWRAIYRDNANIQSGKLTPGRWVVTRAGKIGEIQKRDDRTRAHTQLQLEAYKLANRRETTGRYYVNARNTITTDEITSTEVKRTRR